MFGSYKLKRTYRQLQFCMLCTLQQVSGGSRREEATGTQETLQEILVQKLPLQGIVWEADLTFGTIAVIGVKNPDNKCALALKMFSKTEEAYEILPTYFVCRGALPTQLKSGSYRITQNHRITE